MATKKAHIYSVTEITDKLEIFRCTVNLSFLSGHFKIDKTMVLMAYGALMKVKSIAECSPWSILQYFRPAKGNILQFF